MIFSPQSKVWIYQSNRRFSNHETNSIQQILDGFTQQWKAHGHQLKAKGEIFHNHFIVLTVDEDTAQTTGCSVDASVRIMKEIEQQFDVDLFNRFNMAYINDGEVNVANKEDFETLITAKQINAETIVFNNLVQTLAEFEQKWQVAIKDSWHNNIFAEQLNA
jgi:hypothetical protein